MDKTECGADLMGWSDRFLLGYTPMDHVHREFVDCVAALQGASEADLGAALHTLARHCEVHFAEENRWMRETLFPASECHINEHSAVLASIHAVLHRHATGDVAICRRLGEELANWFPAHADYLDAALAHWMCKRKLGGKPVILRRDISCAVPQIN